MSTEPILLIVSDRAPEELALGPLLEGLGALVECVPCEQLSSAFSVVGPDLVLHWGLARADATAAFLMSQPERDRVQLILLGERSDLAAMRKVRPDLVVAVLAEDIAAKLLAERVMSMAERAARRYGSTPPAADELPPPRPRLPSISDEDERPTEPYDLAAEERSAPVPTPTSKLPLPTPPPSVVAAAAAAASPLAEPATSAAPAVAPPSSIPPVFPGRSSARVAVAPSEVSVEARSEASRGPASQGAHSLQGVATGGPTRPPRQGTPAPTARSRFGRGLWAVAALVPVAAALGGLVALRERAGLEGKDAGASPRAEAPIQAKGPAHEAEPRSPGPSPGPAHASGSDPWIRLENPKVLECEALVSTDLSLRRGDADQANLFWQRARERLLLGDLQGAYLELCRTATVNPGSQIAEGLAEHLLTMGAPGHAQRWADEALRLRPGRPKALELRGDVLSQQGQAAPARDAWLGALGIRSPDDKALSALGQHWVALARDAHRTGNAGLAERLYRRAATVDSKNVEALVGLGRLAHERGEVDRARAWLGRAEALDAQGSQVNALRNALDSGKPVPLATRSSARPRKTEAPSAPADATAPSVPPSGEASTPPSEPSPSAPASP
jgi:Flp pilus assembly protein TadD